MKILGEFNWDLNAVLNEIAQSQDQEENLSEPDLIENQEVIISK